MQPDLMRERYDSGNTAFAVPNRGLSGAFIDRNVGSIQSTQLRDTEATH